MFSTFKSGRHSAIGLDIAKDEAADNMSPPPPVLDPSAFPKDPINAPYFIEEYPLKEWLRPLDYRGSRAIEASFPDDKIHFFAMNQVGACYKWSFHHLVRRTGGTKLRRPRVALFVLDQMLVFATLHLLYREGRASHGEVGDDDDDDRGDNEQCVAFYQGATDYMHRVRRFLTGGDVARIELLVRNMANNTKPVLRHYVREHEDSLGTALVLHSLSLRDEDQPPSVPSEDDILE
ncbi:hypothetical protein N3K66_007975 [Trichothecium roseum]|uniref:Uncharacterized protein n=1 Tax=Trichothecium roseum TaxID=47278 RepID=A0ACC0US79_9HYPO|nr:hypothetical protein N3K66_007975 [Trichothecium roseum]